MKKAILTTIFVVLLTFTLAGPGSYAQDDSASAIEFFYIACERSGVMNLSGFMETGFDAFYQLFSAAAGTGDALSALRRVQVDGDFAFSEELPYNNNAALAAGTIGSARILIAPENNPAAPTFETTVDDLQDGCAAPQNTISTSLDAGEPVVTTQETQSGSGILSPFGGELNPDVIVTPEPVVVLGPREQRDPRRNVDAGLIFAECDEFKPQADPGLLFDTDIITIFWSWFAKTPELVQEHIDNAVYSVKLNTAPLLRVQRSDIVERNGMFWVFWTGTVGRLREGHYEVEFKLDWTQPISDGFDQFGPGTANPFERSLCNFDVALNTEGLRVAHNLIYTPTSGPVHALNE